MTAPVLIRISALAATATGALMAANPALAQDMSYEERVYEYARPAGETVDRPDVAAPQEQVIFTEQPVVQPIPAPDLRPIQPVAPAPVQKVRYIKGPVQHSAPMPQPEYAPAVRQIDQSVHHDREAGYDTNYERREMQHVAPHSVRYAPQQPRYVQQQYAPAYAGPVHSPARQHASYDRDAWLDDCRDRISGRKRGSNGGIIGGLLGAIAGGVVGNRSYDSERLAGTLIGAGVGGLAGLAIGSLIGGSSDRRSDRAYDECEDYLSRWEYQQQSGYHSQYQPAHQRYVMRQVLIEVPQRAVTREYVTTEFVTEYPEHQRTVPVRHIPAPAPVKGKRQRYIKGK